MEIINLEGILLNNLCNNYEITIENINEVYNYLFYNRKDGPSRAPSLHTYCNKCNRSLTFKSLDTTNNFEHLELIKHYKQITYAPDFINYPNLSQDTINRLKYFILNLHYESAFIREFECPNVLDGSHNIVFVLKVIDNCLIKIGQYPNNLHLLNNEISHIRNYKRSIHDELIKALDLKTQEKFVGAYIYLRRILEKYIVNEVFETKVKNEINVDEVKNDKNTFEKKVKYVAELLPAYLTNNHNIYNFLSKGVHSLEEKECAEYFDLVYNSILNIINGKIELEKKKKEEAKMSSMLNDLNSKFNTK